MVKRLSGVAIVVASITTLSLHVHAQEPAMKLGPPQNMTRVGSIEERYQSYNIEMLEVTGGMFWKPYDQASNDRTGGAPDKSGVPAGMDADLYEYRPPVDLSNGKLRKLAAALGPAYVRVSGTWANTTYFADSDPAPSSPPSGFAGVLNRDRWKGVADFAAATDARIVTSMAIGPGVRDAAGVWMPGQAKKFLDYTRPVGGDIAAAEFMNEPTMATMGGAPKGYDAVAFGRDYKLFVSFARQAAPGMRILGPGSVGETTAPDAMIHYGSQGVIATPDMLRQMGADIEAFSYHHYGAASQRCAGTAGMPQTSPDAALSEEWLARTDQTLAFYRNLRDQFASGKPIWVTETADAACGGNPWASTFLDTFRYLDQLGRLVLSFAAANSGGIPRDLLIGVVPPGAVADWRYLGVSLFAGIITFCFSSLIVRLSNPVLLFDAAGLALFAVTGASKALAHGLNPVMAIVLGMVTGIGGGMVRDVLLAEIPTVLRAELYAVAALAAAAIVVVGHMLQLPDAPVMAVAVILCFPLRVMAIRRGWRLPVAKIRDPDDPVAKAGSKGPDKSKR